jgi:hypothetical protein
MAHDDMMQRPFEKAHCTLESFSDAERFSHIKLKCPEEFGVMFSEDACISFVSRKQGYLCRVLVTKQVSTKTNAYFLFSRLMPDISF